MGTRLVTQYVAYEIVPGWRRPAVRYAGSQAPALAARIWARVMGVEGATCRAITEDGEEFGTAFPSEQHGVHGCLLERCYGCGKEFRTPVVGEKVCPGCDLTLSDGRAF